MRKKGKGGWKVEIGNQVIDLSKHRELVDIFTTTILFWTHIYFNQIENVKPKEKNFEEKDFNELKEHLVCPTCLEEYIQNPNSVKDLNEMKLIPRYGNNEIPKKFRSLYDVAFICHKHELKFVQDDIKYF